MGPRKGQRAPSLSALFGQNGIPSPLLQSVSFLALKNSCSLPWKADQERDEQTGWVQEEVGGRGGDSCISLADLEPDWGLGYWVPALCFCEGGQVVTGWSVRAALLTCAHHLPLVSGTEKVPPCQYRLGGRPGSTQTSFSRREKAAVGRAGDPASSVPSQTAKSVPTPFLVTASKGGVVQRVDRDQGFCGKLAV